MTSPNPTFLLETQAVISRTDRHEHTGRGAETLRHAEDVYFKGAKRMLDRSGSRPKVYVDIEAKELYFRELAFIKSADKKLYVALPQELVENIDSCGRNGWRKRGKNGILVEGVVNWSFESWNAVSYNDPKTLENRSQEAPQGFRYVEVPDYCFWYEELKRKEKENDCVVSFVVVDGTVGQEPARLRIAELKRQKLYDQNAQEIWYDHRDV